MSKLRLWKTMGIIGWSQVLALTVIVGLTPPARGDDWV
jgi:hypothetical protein